MPYRFPILLLAASLLFVGGVPVALANHETSTLQLPGLTGPEVLYMEAKESIVVIDPVTLKIIKTLNVGGCFSGLVPTADGKLVYAANPCLDAVVVIDTAGLKVVDTLKAGNQPGSRILLSPDYKTIWVRSLDGVSVIDPAERRFIGSVQTGDASVPDRPGPSAGMIFVPAKDGRPTLLYAINPKEGTVTAIDVDARVAVATIPVGKGARFGIAYSKASDKVYVTNPGSLDISVIDPSANRMIKTIPVGLKGLGTLWFMHNGRYGAVDSRHERGGGDSLIVVDALTDSIAGTIDVRAEGTPTTAPVNPTRVFFTPDDRIALSLHKTSPHVSVVDLANLKVTKQIELMALKKEVTFRCSVFISQDGKTAYVTSAVENTVNVIDVETQTVRAIVMTPGPTCSIYSFRVPGPSPAAPVAVAAGVPGSPVVTYVLFATTLGLLTSTLYFVRKRSKLT